MRRRVATVLTATMLSSLAGVAVATAPSQAASRPTWTKNCTELNKKYRHGVGKTTARDRTSSGRPVTNFKRSNSLHRQAMSYNKGLDRDKDGIACEKR